MRKLLLALLLLPALVWAQPQPPAAPAIAATPPVSATFTGDTYALSLGTVDISGNTNLSATAPITLTGDAVGIDQSATYNWTGTHNWGTNVGVAGTWNAWANVAGAGLVWNGAAAPGTAALKLTGKNNTDRHFHVSVGLTTKPVGGGFFSPIYVDATASYTGGGLIMVAQQFDMTDSRTINAAGSDFLRAFSMNNFRSTSYSNSTTASAGIESLFSDTRDAGYYSNAAGAGWNTYNNRFDTTLGPRVALTSGKTYKWRMVYAGTNTFGLHGSSTGYSNFTYDLGLLDFGTAAIAASTSYPAPATVNFTGVDFQWAFSALPGGTITPTFINYNPTLSTFGGTFGQHHFAKILKGRTWIGADGSDSTTTYDGQLCFGAGTGGSPDSCIYDDGTNFTIATDFLGAGGRFLNLQDQTYTAGAVTADGYVTIKVGGTAYRFLVDLP